MMNDHEFNTYKLANLAEDISADQFEIGHDLRELAKMLPADYIYSNEDCEHMEAIKSYLVEIMHNLHFIGEELESMDVWSEINE